MKFIFLFLFFVLFISLSSCTTLSMSPPQIDFIGKTGETICNDFYIEGDLDYLVTGEDRWAIEGYEERKLSKHNLSSDELDLELTYVKKVELKNKTSLEICVEGKDAGTYHGILLYKIKDKPVKVGIWMEVTLEGFSFESISLGGKSVSEKKGLGLMFVPTLLIAILLVLLWVKNKRRGNEFVK